jgi:hypothetical protein
MMQDIEFKVEAGKIMDSPAGRWMRLMLSGVEVFSEFVYDTDREGNRTELQAKENLIHVFAYRLREVMSERPN